MWAAQVSLKEQALTKTRKMNAFTRTNKATPKNSNS